MSESVEKKRSFIINIAFVAIILALFYFFFNNLFWVTAPFTISFLFAIVCQRPLRWLDRKTKHKCHTLWAILLVLLSIVIILVPVILLISKIVSELSDLVVYLIDQLNDLPTFLTTVENWLLDFLDFLPSGLYASASASIESGFNSLESGIDFSSLSIDTSTITSALSSSASGIYSAVKSVPSAIIGIVIGIVAWILFTKDYDKVTAFIRLQLPEGKKSLLSEIKQVFSKTVLKMIRSYGLIMLITFCELSLGFTILKAVGIMTTSYIYVIALATAIFDILPVAGSGGVLIPWALISLVTGNYQQCIGLLVMYAIITVIRQYIEPKIVGDSLGVNPLVTLAGLYFGLKLFGVLGMFIVPITIMTLKGLNDTGRIKLYNSPVHIDINKEESKVFTKKGSKKGKSSKNSSSGDSSEESSSETSAD